MVKYFPRLTAKDATLYKQELEKYKKGGKKNYAADTLLKEEGFSFYQALISIASASSTPKGMAESFSCLVVFASILRRKIEEIELEEQFEVSQDEILDLPITIFSAGQDGYYVKIEMVNNPDGINLKVKINAPYPNNLKLSFMFPVEEILKYFVDLGDDDYDYGPLDP